MTFRRFLAVAILLFLSVPSLRADQPLDPQVGYVFPSGAKAGSTIDVQLGGFNWTPDVEVFVHEQQVKLELTGQLSRLFPPGAPYFVGTKAYGPPPMPREIAARFSLPADLPPGPIHWQVANANGTSSTGVFMVTRSHEVLENEGSTLQRLDVLPVTVSGRLERNEEVDRYLIRSTRSGPITCELSVRSLGSQFHGVIEIQEKNGRRIADMVDTRGADAALTFAAAAEHEYIVCVRELDFRGNRACVYRLSIDAAPRVVAAVPAAGHRGETRDVEFVGFGVATGTATLETVRRSVTFPGDADKLFPFSLETPFGTARKISLVATDLTEFVKPDGQIFQLETLPAAVTGRLRSLEGTDRVRFNSQQGETWAIGLQACSMAAPLDVHLSIAGPDGKTLAENDDLPGTTDAGLLWTAPANGVYEAIVTDSSGNSGRLDAIYRLSIDRPRPDFSLAVPQRQNVALGETSELVVTAFRRDSFKEPIAITLQGLPDGVSVPNGLAIPANSRELKIPLTAAADAPTAASLVTVTGASTIEGKEVRRVAAAETAAGPVPRLLVATTMQPRVRIFPIESDERTVHRGTTHLAPIATTRLKDFQEPFVIQMDAFQSPKFRQGLFGPDVIVPASAPGVSYPVFVPERTETLDAYRLLLIAVTRVADPHGRQRYLISRMPAPDNSIAITVEGALLKVSLSAEERVLRARAGEVIDVPVRISRSAKMTTPSRLEAFWQETTTERSEKATPSRNSQEDSAANQDQKHEFHDRSKPLVSMEIGPNETEVVLRISPRAETVQAGTAQLIVRATAVQKVELPPLDEDSGSTPMPAELVEILRSGYVPIMSEMQVPVEFVTVTESAPGSR